LLKNTLPFKQYYIIDKKISITRISWHANEKQICWQQSLESRKQCTFIPVCILLTTDNLKAWVCTHPSMTFIFQCTKLTILCFINHLAKKSLSCKYSRLYHPANQSGGLFKDLCKSLARSIVLLNHRPWHSKT
jgi:hypothetical protein